MFSSCVQEPATTLKPVMTVCVVLVQLTMKRINSSITSLGIRHLGRTLIKWSRIRYILFGELSSWRHASFVPGMIESLFPAHQGSGNVQNDIKELKHSFGFDQTDSSILIYNTAGDNRWDAYKLLQFFKTPLMPERYTCHSRYVTFLLVSHRGTRHSPCHKSEPEFSFYLLFF